MRPLRSHRRAERGSRSIAAEPDRRQLPQDPRRTGADRLRGRVRQREGRNRPLSRHPAALFERQRHDRFRLRRHQLERGRRRRNGGRAHAADRRGARHGQPAAVAGAQSDAAAQAQSAPAVRSRSGIRRAGGRAGTRMGCRRRGRRGACAGTLAGRQGPRGRCPRQSDRRRARRRRRRRARTELQRPDDGGRLRPARMGRRGL